MPKTATSRDLRVVQQLGLDLGRVDVDAARDDHVDLAVAQEQVAVVVEVADVADGEEVADAVRRRSSPCRRGTRSPACAELHVDGADLRRPAARLPSSSRMRISELGQALPTVPGYSSHSCGVTSVPPPSLAA